MLIKCFLFVYLFTCITNSMDITTSIEEEEKKHDIKRKTTNIELKKKGKLKNCFILSLCI